MAAYVTGGGSTVPIRVTQLLGLATTVHNSQQLSEFQEDVAIILKMLTD